MQPPRTHSVPIHTAGSPLCTTSQVKATISFRHREADSVVRAMGGFNNLPIADMAPVTIMGHKVYGIFIEPGMGLRWNDAKGTAVDDQAEGQYWVINGHHYNSGCCYDYGNAETDSRDDGDGTMETTYYGNATAWYHGQAPGPWIMTDQENNLVGCVNPSPNDKYCPDLQEHQLALRDSNS